MGVDLMEQTIIFRVYFLEVVCYNFPTLLCSCTR